MALLKKKATNKTNGKKFIKNIIDSFGKGECINNKYINEVILNHPSKKITLNEIEWIKMLTPLQPFARIGSLSLQYKLKNNEKIDDISWRQCVDNIYEKYDPNNEYLKDVKSAFRKESDKGKKFAFLKNNTFYDEINDEWFGIDEDSKKKTTHVSVDHYPISYDEIFNRYIKKKKIKLETIVIEEKDHELIIKDREQARDWLNYHDSLATYRILDSSNNSSKGNYGYTKIRVRN